MSKELELTPDQTRNLLILVAEELKEAKAILRELVNLKLIKMRIESQDGSPDDYIQYATRTPKAWKAAMEFVTTAELKELAVQEKPDD